MAGLVPAIPIEWARPRLSKRDRRVKPGADEEGDYARVSAVR